MNQLDIDAILQPLTSKMRLIGVWPEGPPSLLYSFSKHLTILVNSLLLAIVLLECRKSEDVVEISVGLSLALMLCITLHKQWLMNAKKEQILGILGCLRDPVLARHEGCLNVPLQQGLRVSSLFASVYHNIGLCTGALICAAPMAAMKHGRTLPLGFPVDLQDYPLVVYIATLLYELSGIMITSCIITCYNGILFLFIAIAAIQLRILREKIALATDQRRSRRLLDDDAVNLYLKECVIQHLKIERYIERVQSTFSVGFLLQIIVSVTAICLVGFSMVIVPVRSVAFGRCCFFFCSVTLELALFCVPGNEIIYQSEKIRGACYMCDWNNYGPKVRKTLFIIMERSKRPFQLTASKFVVLSLETLVKVLRSAFSYFTVLMQFYNEP